MSRHHLLRGAGALGVVVGALALAGCGGPDLDAAARASAACVSDVREQLSEVERPDRDFLHTTVRQDDQGWEVEGQVPFTGRSLHCDVVADSSDEARGMRVVDSKVAPVNDS